MLCLNRMVNTCLAKELEEIHAFEQKTLTPEQWEKQQSQWHTLSLQFKKCWLYNWPNALICSLQVFSLIPCKTFLTSRLLNILLAIKDWDAVFLPLRLVWDSRNLISLPRNNGCIFYKCSWIVADYSVQSNKCSYWEMDFEATGKTTTRSNFSKTISTNLAANKGWMFIFLDPHLHTRMARLFNFT